MKSRSVIGLDIGATAVRAVVAEIVGDSSNLTHCRLTGAGSAPCAGLKKGVVVDVDATVQSVEQAVFAATTAAGHTGVSVYVGVTGAHIACLNSSGSASVANPSRGITEKDVERALTASKAIVLPPDRQILHAIPLTFCIDGHSAVQNPIGMVGTRLQVTTHIVHGLTSAINNVGRCVTGAGLDIVELVLAPIATAESVLLNEEKELGVCLLDIGGGTSDLAVFVAGHLHHSAVIPIGGMHVTNDIAYGLTVGHEEAERLKTRFGCSLISQIDDDEVISVKQVGRDTTRKLRRRALVQIIEPRMEELLQFVFDELKASDCLDKIPAGIVITGGGSLIAGCAAIAEHVLQMPVRIGATTVIPEQGSVAITQEFTTAMGLIRYAARHLAVQETVPGTEEPMRGLYNQVLKMVKRRISR